MEHNELITKIGAISSDIFIISYGQAEHCGSHSITFQINNTAILKKLVRSAMRAHSIVSIHLDKYNRLSYNIYLSNDNSPSNFISYLSEEFLNIEVPMV